MLKRTLKSFLEDPAQKAILEHFCYCVMLYQEHNHKYKLRPAYDALPQEFKEAIKPGPRRIAKLYRGDDGKSDEPAISWTGSLSYAKWFGHYVYPFKAVASFEAAIDSEKLVKLVSNTTLDEWGIGDDEDEVILMGVKWKSDKDHEHTVTT
jgi:hypothetical protein